MLGGGQLGRYFVMAAHELGYQVWVLDPDTDSPAGRIADRHLCADYGDEAALAELAKGCAAVTTEFENVPAETLAILAASIPCTHQRLPCRFARIVLRRKHFSRRMVCPMGPLLKLLRWKIYVMHRAISFPAF